ncbi:Dyp-type peroxidase [Methylobacterium oryzisoli]|uniref:Dyp-type peroxidase n=1 Tax=Methylobacterium oryzisoli TaxID=3385502 RepID=UPI00389234C2
MTQSMVTSAIPFDRGRADVVDALLDTYRPDLFHRSGRIREALHDKGVHFLSITVVRGDGTEPTHLVLEISADGGPDDAYAAVAANLEAWITPILHTARITLRGPLQDFLAGHRVRTGQGLLQVAGLDFCGTPGLSVARIKQEWDLARKLRDVLDASPPDVRALDTFYRARRIVAEDPDLKPLLRPEPLERIAAAETSGLDAAYIVGLVLTGLATFLWPVLALLALLLAAATVAAWTSHGATVGALTLVVGLGVALAVVVGGLVALYLALRRKEAANRPVDGLPDPDLMAAIADSENLKDTQQNHLAGISVMQPGLLRELTLRIAFWAIGRMITDRRFRPGFLSDIGTIHYARWLRLPGTNKLLFFSNYGGSWESYLEDFITKASAGLTGAWSNTLGFPRTENLFFKGATDGDRFKRWARRQQQPTRFWYSAYPHLTTARIRTNAAIRQGLGRVSTEDEAAAWLGLFGSKVRPDSLIETFEVQTLLYGGLSRHRFAACLALRLPEEAASARAWLASIAPRITFGDQPPRDKVLIAALSASGLRRLGLPKDTYDAFPAGFRAGMDSPGRATILADTGDDAARHWLWGGPSTTVDAVLLLYADTEATRDAEAASLAAAIAETGGAVIHRVDPGPLPASEGDAVKAVREPFGFVDGVSQPIVRGTRRWLRQSDAIHTVEPGEFLLGYPDGRGYFPPSPTVPAALDHGELLPLADPAQSRGALIPDFGVSRREAARDFGRNGTFLVIRQLAQDVAAFDAYLETAARDHAGHPAIPAQLDPALLPEWIGAKMVGRWKDGSSLVRFPHGPATRRHAPDRFRPDNGFLYGAEDPLGERCPLGAHIRRTNPRESLAPDSKSELGIVNRHRILRVGRAYGPAGSGDPGERKPGLLFMCLNADIERQFEFIQQTWAYALQFHGLENEVDPIIGRGGKTGRLTVPSPRGPLNLTGIKDFVRMRGGAYLFMPSRSALHFLTRLD